jgi:hypothetical protein
MGIQSSMQSLLTVTDKERSFWSLMLASGKELQEHSLVFDFRRGGLRVLDWSLDLVSTGDILKIKELRLHCPDRQVLSLIIEEPGTAFQLKIASMTVLAAGMYMQAHVIGKVLDKESGACVCKVWDREMGAFTFTSSVYAFASWRPGIVPLGALSLDVLGLRL